MIFLGLLLLFDFSIFFLCHEKTFEVARCNLFLKTKNEEDVYLVE